MANKKETKNEIENKTTTKKTSAKKTTENKTVAKKETVKKTNNKNTTKKTVEKKEETKTTAKKETKPVQKKETVKKVTKKEEIKEPEIKKEENKKIETKELSKEVSVAEIQKDDKIIGVFEKIVILVAVALVFSLLGYFIGNNHGKNKIDYSSANQDLQVLIEEYNKIVEQYYKEVDKEALIKGALNGMLSTLDGYSQVIDDSSNSFVITLEGEYEGLGIEIINNVYGEIEIYNVYEDTPAKEAGIKIGDIVTKINDTELKNISTTDFVDMVSNTENIKLTLQRGTKEITVELKKEKIVLKSVSYEMLEDKIGYIKVDIFANNTYEQFKEALEKLEKQKMKSLIIDLRDNTGGHLSTVKDMISLFLDSSHVIYQTETRTETLKFYSSGNKDKTYDIVILQNEVSASASEIMASALSEQLDAYIIGKTSFGKGTVQQLETIDGLGQYKFTTKKWLTSEGVWLDSTGLTPDLDVTQEADYYTDPSQENDTQLQEAIEYLNEK